MQGLNCHLGPDLLTGFGKCPVPCVDDVDRLDFCGYQVSVSDSSNTEILE